MRSERLEHVGVVGIKSERLGFVGGIPECEVIRLEHVGVVGIQSERLGFVGGIARV